MPQTYTDTPFPRWRIFPNALDFIVLAALVFISQMIVAAVIIACGMQLPDLSSMQSPDADESFAASLEISRTIMLLYAPSMLLSILGALIYRRLRGSRGRAARFSAAGFNPSLILAGFIMMLATEIVIEPLLALLPDIPDTVGRGFSALLVTVVLAPLFEEFLCRGIILESFRAKYGVITAWIASSVFFAIIHGQITAMTNALIIGSILGYFCIRARSVWASIILHAINNGLALAAITFGFGDTTFSQLIPDRRIYFAVYAAAAAITFIGFSVILSTLIREHKAEKAADNSAGKQ